ncbi:MAG: hypothetical protein QGG36_28155 [Pirellulaceae bacterium]|jgi:hypothetical protein|nr:hypothetical protein [Pirellulaceae bacterium]MDP7019703.1 hypothetical protein [Pirellulaceae bacterium]
MSLFENPEYQWRETYFVLFPAAKRPSLESVRRTLDSLGDHQLESGRGGEDGEFESISILSPQDFAAMDITYLDGEDVIDHLPQVIEELEGLIEPEDQEKFARLIGFDARLDIFHFEQLVFDPDAGEDDGYLDPGSLLLVLEHLALLCDGVGVDPQSGTLL